MKAEQMKHIFIINPVAGQGIAQKGLAEELSGRNLPFHITERPGAGEEYVKEMCSSDSSETFRFYACGGDGTLNEVVNGAFGFTNAEIAAFPIGSGNDFVRSFDIPVERFRNIDSQVSGKAVAIDAIRYGHPGKAEDQRYAVNMFTMGLACEVVSRAAEVKKIPLVEGSLAYMLSIFLTLIKKKGVELVIESEDGTVYERDFILGVIGNGSFCGGGLKSAPAAVIDDGLMDMCFVDNVPRRTVVSLLPSFAKGTYLDREKIKKYITSEKCRSVTIKSVSGCWALCVDGEVIAVRDTKFEIMPDSVRFSIPLI